MIQLQILYPENQLVNGNITMFNGRYILIYGPFSDVILVFRGVMEGIHRNMCLLLDLAPFGRIFWICFSLNTFRTTGVTLYS